MTKGKTAIPKKAKPGPQPPAPGDDNIPPVPEGANTAGLELTETAKITAPTPDPDDDLQTRAVTRDLYVPLVGADREIAEAELLEVLREEDRIEFSRKKAASEHKDMMDAAVATEREKRKLLELGKMDAVKCQEVRNWTKGTITTINSLTGETVDHRDMTPEEAQRKLDI